jgi:hypothetical protein
LSDSRSGEDTLGRRGAKTTIMLIEPHDVHVINSGIPDSEVQARVRDAVKKYLTGETVEIRIYRDWGVIE